MGHAVDLQRAAHVLDRGDAVDQPGVLVAADDLLLVPGRDHVAHDDAHHVVEADQADHQAVFVDDQGEGFAGLAELLEHFGQGQAVRHHQRLADQGGVVEGDRLVVQHPLEQVLDGDVADDVVDVAVADRVGGVGLVGDPRADQRIGVVAQEVDDAFAVGHGAGQGAGFQLEDVLDDLLLAGRQGAGLGAGLGHGHDVLGGDAVVALLGQLEQVDQAADQPGVDQYQRLEQDGKYPHRADDADGELFGNRHGDLLGNQVGDDDEQRGGEGEGHHEAEGGGLLRVQPQGEQLGEQRAEHPLADDAAEDGQRVHADLHHGEVVAGFFLDLHDPQGVGDAFIGHLPQPHRARGGQGDFGEGEERADQDEQKEEKQALADAHRGCMHYA
ncbi:hypothetical protein D3C81_1124390 [compost metagenome]